MNGVVRRGALIVLEGCDRCGKSTQARKLVDTLVAGGTPAELWRFPERSSSIGQLIGSYLEKKSEVEDHAIHLLFSANRWESVPRMRKLLQDGTTVVVDRYAYSGVAFTAAKEGFDIEWCKQPDRGLPEPDLVLYLTIGAEDAAKRADFGGERYEQTDFQKRVADMYGLLREDRWETLDASQSIKDLHDQIAKLTRDIITRVENKPINKLWM
ncbi:thymidylate kinase-like [Saccoglossus kowalevskii]|uniref:dTMP kinase n=1 Tax=Saccoglossus kowalevskii TaxID=10224 RepID=A0ABM0LV64_SACKO|nr:PREDICTED: thymidylate kinase-like [Saccoglossus kowalevskii]